MMMMKASGILLSTHYLYRLYTKYNKCNIPSASYQSCVYQLCFIQYKLRRLYIKKSAQNFRKIVRRSEKSGKRFETEFSGSYMLDVQKSVHNI